MNGATTQVDILVNNGSAIVKLAERKEGEAFGEIALLEDAPRTATVKAAEGAFSKLQSPSGVDARCGAAAIDKIAAQHSRAAVIKRTGRA